jgi:hypothetical protein
LLRRKPNTKCRITKKLNRSDNKEARSVTVDCARMFDRDGELRKVSDVFDEAYEPRLAEERKRKAARG